MALRRINFVLRILPGQMMFMYKEQVAIGSTSGSGSLIDVRLDKS